MAVDLHTHSINSDGSNTSSEIVEMALSKGLSAIALTDHDTVRGVEEFYAYGRGKDIELISGAEFSTMYHGVAVHVLGLYLNPFKEAFVSQMQQFIESRDSRNVRMAERMNELGYTIDYKEFKKSLGPKVITRSHFARYMVDHGYIPTMEEAFEKYFNPGGICYVPRAKIEPCDVIPIIEAGGGITVLAHPLQYGFEEEELEGLIQTMIDAGLKGMEVYYSKYNKEQIAYLEKLADKYNLIKTGGSDYHGSNRPGCEIGTGYGDMNVPDCAVEELHKEYLKDFKISDEPGIMFFDMDGTLLNDEKIITEKTYEALDEVVKKGYTFAISTGRPLKSILKVADRLGLRERYNPMISSYNGSIIYDCKKDEIVDEQYLSKDVVKAIRDIAYSYKVHIHSYSLDEILTERETEEVKAYCEYIKMEYKLIYDMLDNEKAYKLMIMDLNDHELLEEVKKVVMEKYSDKVYCVFSTPILLEVLPVNSGKGKALITMSKLLGIDEKNTYAFADAENDITMLEAAGRGVCLVNGYSKAMAAADYITFTDNNHDGIVPFLKKLTER